MPWHTLLHGKTYQKADQCDKSHNIAGLFVDYGHLAQAESLEHLTTWSAQLNVHVSAGMQFQTPLMMARQFRHADIVKMLLQTEGG